MLQDDQIRTDLGKIIGNSNFKPVIAFEENSCFVDFSIIKKRLEQFSKYISSTTQNATTLTQINQGNKILIYYRDPEGYIHKRFIDYKNLIDLDVIFKNSFSNPIELRYANFLDTDKVYDFRIENCKIVGVNNETLANNINQYLAKYCSNRTLSIEVTPKNIARGPFNEVVKLIKKTKTLIVLDKDKIFKNLMYFISSDAYQKLFNQLKTSDFLISISDPVEKANIIKKFGNDFSNSINYLKSKQINIETLQFQDPELSKWYIHLPEPQNNNFIENINNLPQNNLKQLEYHMNKLSHFYKHLFILEEVKKVGGLKKLIRYIVLKGIRQSEFIVSLQKAKTLIKYITKKSENIRQIVEKDFKPLKELLRNGDLNQVKNILQKKYIIQETNDENIFIDKSGRFKIYLTKNNNIYKSRLKIVLNINYNDKYLKALAPDKENPNKVAIYNCNPCNIKTIFHVSLDDFSAYIETFYPQIP
jgi:hypothetical protein